MSALPLKADMCSALARVRYGPIADSCTAANITLFNHLIGACEQRRRNSKAKSPGRLEIDHEFELGRCLDRKVGRLLALEDAVDVIRRSIGSGA